jgi:hypothetical protein
MTQITTADFDTIKLERADRVAVLTLNRPEALNALNAQLMNETVVTNSVPTVRYSAARTPDLLRALGGRLTRGSANPASAQDISASTTLMPWLPVAKA